MVLVSFGFIGLECVSMLLGDPLLEVTNGINEHGASPLVYEDLYLAFYRTDGPDAAARLRTLQAGPRAGLLPGRQGWGHMGDAGVMVRGEAVRRLAGSTLQRVLHTTYIKCPT